MRVKQRGAGTGRRAGIRRIVVDEERAERPRARRADHAAAPRRPADCPRSRADRAAPARRGGRRSGRPAGAARSATTAWAACAARGRAAACIDARNGTIRCRRPSRKVSSQPAMSASANSVACRRRAHPADRPSTSARLAPSSAQRCARGGTSVRARGACRSRSAVSIRRRCSAIAPPRRDDRQDAQRLRRRRRTRRRPRATSAVRGERARDECRSLVGRRRQREHRHQDVGKPECEHPHESVGGERDVQRQRRGSRETRPSDVGAGERNGGREHDDERRRARPSHARSRPACPSLRPDCRRAAPQTRTTRRSPPPHPRPGARSSPFPCPPRSPPRRGCRATRSRRVHGSAATGCRVATGSSCRLAPIAVIASVPSVTRCSAATGQPSPPAKRGTASAPANSATHASK